MGCGEGMGRTGGIRGMRGQDGRRAHCCLHGPAVLAFGPGVPVRLTSRCAFPNGPSWTMGFPSCWGLGAGDFEKEKAYHGQAQEVDSTTKEISFIASTFLPTS